MHHGSVLVHCQRGVSRSVTCACFFLMRKVGMTLESALKLCRARRSVADPIPAFVEQLEEYEKKCVRIGSIKVVESKKRKQKDESGSSCITKARLETETVGPMMPPNQQKEDPIIGPALPSKSICCEEGMSSAQNEDKGNDEKSLKEKLMEDPRIGPALPPKSECVQEIIGPVMLSKANNETGE
mmetsp:Transcript_13201/g.20069  ORF Transcript_13201/g.20069 Transcript_13201/m.20069 type:complete len:184 (+) Transcript_13201:160-711(+)